MKQLTYIKRRKCLHCSNPISDQKHALQKFCKREKLEDGTVNSCKDDYNSAKRKVQKSPFKWASIHQERMWHNLKHLHIKFGENITIELINRNGVILNRPAEISWLGDGGIEFWFVEYKIVLHNKQYKIFKHARVF